MEEFQIPSHIGTSGLLLAISGCVFLIWLIQFHWNRRQFYRLSAQLPGPLGLPILGNALDFIGGPSDVIFHRTLCRYFERYNNFFRFWIGPEMFVVVGEPENVEIVLNSPHSIGKNFSYKFLQFLGGNGLLTAPVNIWKKNRKLINSSFSQKILNSYVHVFSEKSKSLVEVLKGNVGIKNLDIMPLISASLLDTLCETAMGIKVESEVADSKFGEILERITYLVMLRIRTVWYYSDFIFNRSKYGKELEELSMAIRSFTEKVISEKLQIYKKQIDQLEAGEIVADEDESKTFLNRLILLSHGNTKLSNEELRDEVNTFMAAGSDTTTVLVCFSFVVLGMYPEIQKKVYNEVMDVLGADREVSVEDLPHLRYLERFIKETLRLFPTGPVIAREVSSNLSLNGVIIPEHTSILISLLHLHRNPKYWKDPFKFDPDRFLPEEVATRHPYSYLPFSAGPRGCIGMKFGLMLSKTVLATMVRKFFFKTEYKSIEQIDLNFALILRPAQGYKVSLELRK